MKTFGVVAGLALLTSQAHAHYIFEFLTVNGVKGTIYQNIRENTDYNSPVTDLTSNDLRCNVGANGSTTSTVSVAAGSTVTFTADIAVYHNGPISWYMHKSPTTASADDGSGNTWFKIKDVGPTFDASGTATWDLQQSYSATLPASLPNGDYLLRIQSLAIHNPWPAGIPQFYTSCAQITITGGGNGVPSPLCSIPGFISNTDPGYTVNIYTNFHNYTVPGPAVWSGGGSSGGGTTSSSAKTTSTAASSSSSKMTTSSSATSTKATSTKASSSATSSAASSGGTAQLYGQCGGIGWTGPTVCAAGTCKYSNAYYSQCLA